MSFSAFGIISIRRHRNISLCKYNLSVALKIFHCKTTLPNVNTSVSNGLPANNHMIQKLRFNTLVFGEKQRNII